MTSAGNGQPDRQPDQRCDHTVMPTVSPLLTPCSAWDRSTLAALVDAERSWVGPGLQLYLADVSDDASWRQTFRIGPCDGFLRAEAERHPAGMWGGGGGDHLGAA